MACHPREECLNPIIVIGRAPLHRAVSEFMEHDHAKRYHQGLDNQLNRIRLTQNVSVSIGIVRSQQRHGGIPNVYFRGAA